MAKPHLLVVTGRPGSGKTTLAKALSEQLFMPLISRDQIKEGYVHTMGKGHNALPDGANRAATEIFFDTLGGLVANGVSIIAEAAFQHGIWSAMLEPFMGSARITLLICRVDDAVALERFIRRGLDNASREYFHGDAGVDRARAGLPVRISPYEPPRLGVPTIYVDTLGPYNPSIRDIGRQILGHVDIPG